MTPSSNTYCKVYSENLTPHFSDRWQQIDVWQLLVIINKPRRAESSVLHIGKSKWPYGNVSIFSDSARLLFPTIRNK